jgi:hypothetical protein
LNALANAGIAVPIAWEHQDDAKPQTAAERKAGTARFNLGFADAAQLDPAGPMNVLLDVPNGADAERLASVRYVSPEIVTDFIDGMGRKWPGETITHFAVTSRPVQPNQKPFQLVQLSGSAAGKKNLMRLSLKGFSMALNNGSGDVYGDGQLTGSQDYPGDSIGRRPGEQESTVAGQTEKRRAFARQRLRELFGQHGVQLPLRLAEDLAEMYAGGGGARLSRLSQDVAGYGAGDSGDDAAALAGGGSWPRVRALLAQLGIALPNSYAPQTLQDLIEALQIAAVAAAGADNNDDEDGNASGTAESEGLTPGQPPMAMSLRRAGNINDPRSRRIALSVQGYGSQKPTPRNNRPPLAGPDAPNYDDKTAERLAKQMLKAIGK